METKLGTKNVGNSKEFQLETAKAHGPEIYCRAPSGG